MNLHDRVEFEKQLVRYLAAHGTAREHNARCDFITWVSAYATLRSTEAVAKALLQANHISGPISDVSGGP